MQDEKWKAKEEKEEGTKKSTKCVETAKNHTLIEGSHTLHVHGEVISRDKERDTSQSENGIEPLSQVELWRETAIERNTIKTAKINLYCTFFHCETENSTEG